MNQLLHRNWRSIFIGFSIFTDVGAIATTGLISYHLRSFIPKLEHLGPEVFIQFTLWFGALLVGSGLFLGLYRGAFHLDNRRLYLLAGRAYFYSVLIVLASFYILQQLDIPRRYTLLFFLTLPVNFTFGRALLHSFNKSMQSRGFGIHRTLLVGYGDDAARVVERIWDAPELGYQVRGVLSERKPSNMKGLRELDIQWHPSPEFATVVRVEKIDRVFVPSADLVQNGYGHVAAICQKEKIKLKILSPSSDELLQLAKVYDIAGITLVSPERIHVEQIKRFIKRGVDILGAAIALALLSPVFLITAAAVVMESGFPAFFKQKRSAIKGGKTFHFYKFRSMVKNADELKDSLLKLNESSGALFKLRDDPRMTKTGRFIRKYSIDELPQLFNVLKGDMSLVGPRPLPIADFNKVDEPEEFWEIIKDREKVKPGMTGLWQISGRSNIGFEEMVLLDLYYAENHSLLFDLEIIAATIPVVLFSRGAY